MHIINVVLMGFSLLTIGSNDTVTIEHSGYRFTLIFVDVGPFIHLALLLRRKWLLSYRNEAAMVRHIAEPWQCQ